jgi:integrase
MGNLTATGIAALNAPGKYSDGNGLFLWIKSKTAKSWVVRVQKDGKRRDIGLGPLSKVTLAEARKRAAVVRAQMEAKVDPVAERRKAAGVPTFRVAAAAVFSEQAKAWRNAKHSAQWLRSLETHAFPSIGDMTVDRIATEHVRDLLATIWLTVPETARRIRQRVGQVIDWSVAKGYRASPLAMAVINRSLPTARPKRGHHAAMPYPALPAWLAGLRAKPATVGRLALEFAILTAARSGEARGADWSEIDLEARVWSIPADRMKAGHEHMVPLSDAAVAVLQKARPLSNGRGLVFPSPIKGKQLSDMTLLKVLRDDGLGATPHGMRATFRTWVQEQTSAPHEVGEKALAHTQKDATVSAYARSNLLEKRIALMSQWADFCDGGKGKVVRLVG